MAECCIPRRIHNSAQISEVNCAPLSDVIVIIVGTPKRAKLKNSALEQSLLQVDLSMIVNICVKPLEDGRGPTISMYLHVYVKNIYKESSQLSHHSFTSLLSFFLNNFAEIILLVALIPGCEIVQKKNFLFIISGTS